MLSMRAELPASPWRHSGGSSRVTQACEKGECNDDVWMPCDGKVPLYWWFLTGLV